MYKVTDIQKYKRYYIIAYISEFTYLKINQSSSATYSSMISSSLSMSLDNNSSSSSFDMDSSSTSSFSYWTIFETSISSIIQSKPYKVLPRSSFWSN